jgi:hypothetical protein
MSDEADQPLTGNLKLFAKGQLANKTGAGRAGALQLGCRASSDPGKITSICLDFLVELRGFEPLTSALGARGDCGAASVLQGVLSKARRWIPP